MVRQLDPKELISFKEHIGKLRQIGFSIKSEAY